MMTKGCSPRLINSSSNRHRVSLAELLSSGFINPPQIPARVESTGL